MKKYAVVSLSGGMDSTSLLLKLLVSGYEKIYGISFNYGQKHMVELEKLKKNIEYLSDNRYKINHSIVDLSDAMSNFNSSLTDDSIDVPTGFYAEDNMKSTVVQNRNAIFSSIIYGYALSLATKFNINVDISLGVHSGDHAIYPDCRPEFYKKLHEAFKSGNWDSDMVDLKLPYIDTDKVGILKDAIESSRILNLDFDTIFKNTSTTYNPTIDGKSNGETGSDVERILAFNELRLVDPAEYTKDWNTLVTNAKQLENEYNEK
jgi:7-cyano-7-deazaguanine synthase